jgi:acyl dehydratase
MTESSQSSPAHSSHSNEGMFYEDFEVGRIYAHRMGRTMIEADNAWLTLIALGINQVHFNDYYSAQTPFKKPIIASPFTLAVVTGLSAAEFGQNTMANLGWNEVKLPHPVFVGDTIYARSKVTGKRESASRPYAGIVNLVTEGFNQDGTIVMTFSRNLMAYKRGHAPSAHMPTPVGSAMTAS